MIPINRLNPFRRFCMTIGELPTSYVESMSYAELLTWLCNYLQNTVIPAINTNAEAVTELQNLYQELKTYVDNYFENLDVQTEINNKLDDMAESGELTDIIAQYLELAGILAFNTKNDLKGADNLSNGSFTKTFGDTTYNDGKGHFYKIRTVTTGDVIDDDNIIALTNYPTLIAEKINDFEIDEIYKDIFYKEIDYTMNRTSNTDYYLVTIPKYDENGDLIQLEINKDMINSPVVHAQKNLTSFTCNATLAVKDDDDNYYDTLVISNGEIVNPVHEFTTPLSNDYQYLCIDENRNFSSYRANSTSAETLLNAGVKQAWLVFYKVIENGEFIDHNNDISNIPDDIRQILGVKANGDVVLFTNDGRINSSHGFTDAQACAILIANGVVNAWELDGGGSASTSVKTIKINRSYDESLTKDRNIHYTLNAKKSSIYKNVGNTYAEISKQKQLYNYQMMNYVNSQHNMSMFAIRGQTISGTDTYNTINTLDQIQYYGNTNITVAPAKVTVNKSGIYTILADIQVTLQNGTKYIEIFVNGTQRYTEKFTGSNGDTIDVPVLIPLTLSTGDEIEFKYYGANNDKIDRGYVQMMYYGL